jgi:iron complex outermembrane recepter protein
MKYNRLVIALAAIFGASAAAVIHAQGVATDQQLAPQKVDKVEVAGQRPPLDPNLPASTASKSAEDLAQQQNLFNPEDALRNLPNTTIRKRYSGDRNALIGGRSFSTLQAPRGLVFLDGYLLSNFLGRFDAPRWNMIAPEEMSRIDVMYGPFSAIYPGNSIGTTVVVTTRKPEKFEASVRVAAQFHRYEDYGYVGNYDNHQLSAYLGAKLDSGLWYSATFNRQDSQSQPMQYFTINAGATGTFAPLTGTQPILDVNGVRYDTAPTGQRRAVFGPNSGAFDDTLQHTLKTRIGYDWSNVSAELLLAGWRNDTFNTNDAFLRNAGDKVWSGRIRDIATGNTFNIAANVFAPSSRDETHAQAGITVKTRNKTGWNASFVGGYYSIRDDEQRNANNPDNLALSSAPGAGTATLRDGTQWRTSEIQLAYTPSAGDWGNAKHTLALGLHGNDYRLRQHVVDLTDWRASAVDRATVTQRVGGDTALTAIYVQDAWRFADQWVLTAGARYERWKATNGVQQLAPSPALLYSSRSISAVSPKLSISYAMNDDTTLRVSAGRGTRFPTVVELFQGNQSGSSIVVNDPNLKPERSNALEFTVDRRFAMGDLRISLFQDDVRDTIWSQTNILVFPNVTNVQNIDRVRTRGVEVVGNLFDVGVKGLNIEGSVSFNDAEIVENAKFPLSIGKQWPRVPRVRSALTATYAPSKTWSASTTYRYAGRQFNSLLNDDTNPDTYGGLSRVHQLDVKFRYVMPRGTSLTEFSAGVDNVNDYKAYQSHPLPGRTFFVELRHGF